MNGNYYGRRPMTGFRPRQRGGFQQQQKTWNTWTGFFEEKENQWSGTLPPEIYEAALPFWEQGKGFPVKLFFHEATQRDPSTFKLKTRIDAHPNPEVYAQSRGGDLRQGSVPPRGNHRMPTPGGRRGSGGTPIPQGQSPDVDFPRHMRGPHIQEPPWANQNNMDDMADQPEMGLGAGEQSQDYTFDDEGN